MSDQPAAAANGAAPHLDGDVFYPAPEVVQQATVPDWDAVAQRAAADLTGFWEEQARELEWYKPWDTVLDETKKPFFKWFVGAQTNIVHNCLDRYLKTATRNKTALIWEGEKGDTREFSFASLNREVSRFANVLKGLGIAKGDLVTIYMGRVPEIIVAMLACAKVGAIHSVVYGGFSVDSLAGRIDDSQSRVAVTCDGAFLNGKTVELKRIMDEALTRCPTVEHLVVVQRTSAQVGWVEGRDHWYHDLMADPAITDDCPTEVMDAEDPLYILYTSGTTGKPKAILHTHGGYMVGVYASLKMVFDLKPADRWWCAADPGWVTGHSYIVYGPLLNAATSFMYEGAPAFPAADRWWSLVAKYDISIFYTAPTAIRGLMRFGETWPDKHDLSSLRLLGTVGEPINPAAWKWYHRVIGHGRCPIMDTWWQTETGMFMITPTPVVALKPGSGTRPFFGQEAQVVDDEGNPMPDGQEGYLVLLKPWPAMLRTVFKDPERYVSQYWSRYPGKYTTGDSARRDKDGYFWIIGRVDDVIKVSGYRFGTAEIESSLVSHPAVAEAAAIGLPHEIKGTGIHAFAILRQGYEASEALQAELVEHVGKTMGKIARPETVTIVDKLPKTRSGKIMRRVLKARAQGLPEGDISTLEE